MRTAPGRCDSRYSLSSTSTRTGALTATSASSTSPHSGASLEVDFRRGRHVAVVRAEEDKMNWNSANFGGSYPITLKFSDLVGEVMREIPADRDPLPQFKFYI